MLDRNGLRPSRYWVTADGLVVMASEVGVLDIDPAEIVQRGRLQPGRMFLVDTAQGRIIGDEELKQELAAEHPYAEWLHAGLVHLDDLPPRRFLTPQHGSVVQQQRVFGYTTEEIKILLTPMAKIGYEPIGSMGTDTPIAALSDRPRLLFDYFQQLFAQVTNPPLDAIREELVTSLSQNLGPEEQPARSDTRVVPADRAAAPDPVERRPGEAAVHQRGRRPPRLPAVRGRRAVPGGRGRRRPAARRSTTCAPP